MTPRRGRGRPKKYLGEHAFLNLRIPAEIKEYLLAAAYRESSPVKMCSVTEYLVKLVRKDMERHK